ncbi:hypothetical protein INT45_001590 [Circinella minor]|uniref:Myb-like, SWIRM and MPN domain-containing protein 1 n=1 Tax=Circinella minor TaxID=1195481 RepID=A0A8H7S5X5_9FUNG|nr:hypothetical protein INT45_001590 [Circinella minor]
MAPKKNNKKKEPISKAEEEEMSSALIARLLAEDAMQSGASNDDYYTEYSNEAGAYEQYHARGGEDYNDGNYEDDSEDDNYAPKKKTSRAKSKASPGPGKRGRKRKASEPEETESNIVTTTTTTTATENEENQSTTTTTTKTEKHSSSSSTPIKKPKKPVPEGCNTGVYSEEEESKFLEGLRLFGRDWPKLAAHIKTRDSNSIRSHAQKHFIKMYRDKIPLPDKVRESGEGYTLSGKPLDPNSAAARAYLARSSVNQNKSKTTTTKETADSTTNTKNENTNNNDDDKIQSALSQSQPEQVSEHMEQQHSSEQSSNSTSTNTTTTTTTIASTNSISGITDNSNTTSTSTEDPTNTLSNLAIGDQLNNKHISSSPPPPSTISTQQKRKTSPKAKQTKPHRSVTPEQRNNASAYDENGRTSYSKLRLRRTRERPSIMYSQLNKDDDPLTMIKCEPFNGKPGSNILGCQPFELQVHSNVLLQMDFHAHLMTTEIIGFLAGEWDKVKKKMCIKEAFPCRSLNTGQNDVNVEMDPTSAIETRQLIEEKNMTVVGWYHSHPTFIPDPSIVDLENQRNYQILCREKCHHGDDGVDDPMVIDGQEEQVRGGGGGTIEPFVGAIVGPYDPRLPGSASVINWFYVGDSNDDRKIPKRLIYELQNDQSISSENADRLFDLLNVYKDSPEKVDFTDLWRQDSHESKLEKIIKSLGVRMPWIERPNNNNNEDENMDEQQQQKEESTSNIDSFLTRLRDSLKDW